MYRVVLLALFFMQADARPSQLVQLRIEAPPKLAAVRNRLESIDPQRSSTFGRDCELWSDQVTRIATDTLSTTERMRQYFSERN